MINVKPIPAGYRGLRLPPVTFSLLLVTCCLSLVTVSHAWDADAHRKIVTSSSQHPKLSKDLRIFLTKNAAFIADAAALPEPDDKNAPMCHSAKSARIKVNALVRRVLSNKRGRVVAENFGRLSHYLADINHPLSIAEPGPAMEKAYTEYEHARAAQNTVQYPDNLPLPARIEDIENYSGRQWDDAEKVLSTVEKSGADTASLAEIQAVSQNRINASIEDTLAVWISVWNLKLIEPLKQEVESAPTPESYAALARQFIAQRRLHEAAQTLDDGDAKFGVHEKLVLARVQLCIIEQDYHRGVELCADYLRNNPANHEARYLRAVCQDHWLRKEPANVSVKENTIAAWRALKGTPYDKMARSKLSKLK